MSLLKKNIIANLVGNVWQALMVLAFVPLYIKFMGVESYGLIGVFVSLQAVVAVLDMGIGATLTREMARLSALSGKEQEMRDLLRSLEIIYWGVAIAIGVAVVGTAPWIAYHWLKPGHLSSHTIEGAIMIMGLSMAFQWPGSFYSGGLIGLQKQVLLNVVNGVFSTLRGAGAVLVLWLISPTIQAFFLWQVVISIIGTCCLRSILWHKLPGVGGKTVFRKQLLKGVWKFSLQIAGISLLSMVLIQSDKVVLSKMLSLEMFGYYTLAVTVSFSLARLMSPVFSAVYPRLTQLASVCDGETLKELYHKSCQFMSVLILPVAIVIAIFSFEIMLLWMHNPLTAQKTHLLISILICGTALNGLMNIPYALQLAHGWTKLTLYVSLIAVVTVVPLIVFLTFRYGALGGASGWVIINAGYVFFTIHFMHRRLLPHEKWRWYGTDVALPLGASVLTAGILRLIMPASDNKFILGGYIAMVLLITLTAAALAAPFTRSWIKNRVFMETNKN